jgi:hypothetical protein
MKQLLALLLMLGWGTFCAANPSETVLISDVSVPLIVEGKQVGSMTLMAGSAVTFVKIEGESAWVSRGDSQPFKIPRLSIKPIEQKPTPQIGVSQINQSNAPTGTPVMSPSQAATSNNLSSKLATVQSVRAHPSPSSFPITINGEEVIVTKIGDGPIGVTFFPHSNSEEMQKFILQNKFDLLNSLNQCTFFVWNYPKNKPFSGIRQIIDNYMRTRSSGEIPLQGMAASIVNQIEEKSGIRQRLLIGNSMGAGMILFDYTKLLEDPDRKILLISPSRPFMPTMEQIPPLNRTILLAAQGDTDVFKDHSRCFDDLFISDDMKDWVVKNTDPEICGLIQKKNERSAKIGTYGKFTYKKYPDEVFLMGHKIIGGQVSAKLLIKLIRIELGLADKNILLE